MGRLRVATIVGTRPEIIRLARVIPELDKSYDHVLVHTGQNYDHELNQIFFDDLKLRNPDSYLEAARGNANQTIAAVVAGVDNILNEVKPDAVLVLGDTNSCLGLLAAKKLRIPTFHMDAGNRCFDLRVPEETNRRLIDHTADINLPYSQIARQYLLREGLPPDQVIVTGSPMREVLHYYADQIERSSVLSDLGLEPDRYFVVSLHREENVAEEDQFRGFVEMLNELATRYSQPVIVSCHPRTRNQIDRMGVKFHPNVRLLKPLSFTSYVSLQQRARAVLSDSGTISEEAAILGLRAVNLRESHERPEAMEEGAVMMVGRNPKRLFNALEILDRRDGASNLLLPRDYAPLNVSTKVARIVLSYTDYVNRQIWKK